MNIVLCDSGIRKVIVRNAAAIKGSVVTGIPMPDHISVADLFNDGSDHRDVGGRVKAARNIGDIFPKIGERDIVTVIYKDKIVYVQTLIRRKKYPRHTVEN